MLCHTIVGVAPEGFYGLRGLAMQFEFFFIPARWRRIFKGAGTTGGSRSRWMSLRAARPGVTRVQAHRRFRAANSWNSDVPDTNRAAASDCGRCGKRLSQLEHLLPLFKSCSGSRVVLLFAVRERLAICCWSGPLRGGLR